MNRTKLSIVLFILAATTLPGRLRRVAPAPPCTTGTTTCVGATSVAPSPLNQFEVLMAWLWLTSTLSVEYMFNQPRTQVRTWIPTSKQLRSQVDAWFPIFKQLRTWTLNEKRNPPSSTIPSNLEPSLSKLTKKAPPQVNQPHSDS
jgi:hypothetical protein